MTGFSRSRDDIRELVVFVRPVHGLHAHLRTLILQNWANSASTSWQSWQSPFRAPRIAPSICTLPSTVGRLRSSDCLHRNGALVGHLLHGVRQLASDFRRPGASRNEGASPLAIRHALPFPDRYFLVGNQSVVAFWGFGRASNETPEPNLDRLRQGADVEPSPSTSPELIRGGNCVRWLIKAGRGLAHFASTESDE